MLCSSVTVDKDRDFKNIDALEPSSEMLEKAGEKRL